MSWNWEDTDEVLMALGNLIGPEAIKRKMKLFDVDKGKPLSKNVASTVNIIGEFIRYEDHTTNHPLLDTSLINGLELPVTGGEVKRIEDGRIYAIIKLAKSAPLLGSISEFARRDDEFDFYSSVEYISNNPEAPTIFQSLYNSSTPAGTMIPMPGMGKFQLPFGFTLSAITEAIGFVDGDVFKGTMQLQYEFFFDRMPPNIRFAFEQRFGKFPPIPRASGGGKFEVKLLNP